MKRRKISLDIDDKVYYKLKKDALEKRVTMTKLITDLLGRKYGDSNE
jgi:hypothetical protein